MKERPILFSAPMVRAILAGTKTQTRRVVKWQGPKGFPHDFNKAFTDNPAGIRRLLVPYHHPDDDYADGCAHRHYPPHGDPGDRLWVREAFIAGYDAHDGVLNCVDEHGNDLPQKVWYRATPPDNFEWLDDNGYTSENVPWKPSIHMPRRASRITLEITGVRVERLQDISRGDCMQEGCPFPNIARETDPKKWFADLWESINGPGTWALNPWVWVIEFKRT